MNPQPYEYRGAEVLVALHEAQLREFLEVWRQFEALGLELPASTSPDYASREALLAHVLGAAARYLTWMCEKLELPRPELEERPDPSGFGARAGQYLDDVLAAWQLPLREVTEEQADGQAFTSRWGIPYSIDAMLEHAVMHPLRHAYQLRRLMAGA